MARKVEEKEKSLNRRENIKKRGNGKRLQKSAIVYLFGMGICCGRDTVWAY